MTEASAVAADSVLRVLQTAETHLASEYVDDLEATLASVTATPTYAFMPEPGAVKVVTTPAGVEQFYVDARAAFEPIASRLITHITSDWYEFQDNVPTRRSEQTGELMTLNTVNIFPAAADGIQGEFLWERYPSDEQPPVVPAELGPAQRTPTLALRNAKLHEAFLDRLRVADLDGLLAACEPDCLWATRSYLPDAGETPLMVAENRDRLRELLVTWTETFEVVNLSVLTRHSTDWYVFAEELYTVRHRGGERAGETSQFRKATVYPIGAGGRIQGEIGYGTEMHEPVPRSRTEVGRVGWVAQHFNDRLCEPD